MVFALDQTPASKSVTTTGTSDTSTPFASTPAAGALVVVALAMGADGITFSTPPTINGGAFTFTSPIFTDNSTASQSVAIWLAEYAGSGTTITASWSAAVGGGGTLTTATLSGMLSGPTLDGSVASARTDTPLTGLTYTPDVTGDALFYYISTVGAVSSITGSGWTLIEGNMAGSSNAWAWQVGALSQVTGTADQGSSDLGIIFGVELGTATNPDLNVYRIN